MSSIDWPEMALGELTTKVGSGATPKGGSLAYQDAGTPFIRSMNVVFFGFKRDGLVYLDSKQSAALKGVEVRANDVLLNITGASIGRVTLAPKDLDGARVNQHVCIIRPTAALDARYLRAYLSSPDVQASITQENYGVTRQALTKQQILSFRVPVPPLTEQRRIADKLDALLVRVAGARDRLNRLPTILTRFRQAVLSSAMTGNLTEEWRAERDVGNNGTMLAEMLSREHLAAGGHKPGNAASPTEGVHNLSEADIPAGWGLTTLRDVVDPKRPITYGILKPGPELSDGVPYVRVADFPNNRLDLRGIRRTSPAIDSEFKRSKLRAGDLLLSIRGTVGRIVEIPPELEGANITQDSARLSVQSSLNPLFVLWYLRSESPQLRMQRAVKGVAVRGINIGDVRALQVPIPSRAEQDEIVRRIESLLLLSDVIERRYERAWTQVRRLTPAMLAKAFRGELVPRGAADESATPPSHTMLTH